MNEVPAEVEFAVQKLEELFNSNEFRSELSEFHEHLTAFFEQNDSDMGNVLNFLCMELVHLIWQTNPEMDIKQVEYVAMSGVHVASRFVVGPGEKEVKH